MTTRRDFLSGATAAALLAAHGDLSWATPLPQVTMNESSSTTRLLHVRLSCAAPLSEMRSFYGDQLGLPVVDEDDGSLTLVAGSSRLTFTPAGEGEGEPFYHFAFNVPENKILDARQWQLERTPLIPAPDNLRDPELPADVIDYRHWNAHSLFFWDPAGNIVEHIARHDLDNAAPGPFTSGDILNVSEIAFAVQDVDRFAAEVRGTFALEQYRGGSDAFRAIGDENGLLLTMERGRNMGFGDGKPLATFPVRAEIHGPADSRLQPDGLPFEIVSRG